VAAEFKEHGSTPWVEKKLGEIMTRVHWGLGSWLEFESPDYEKALVACDKAFTLKDLKGKCRELGSSMGPKKEMCHKLYLSLDPDVVEVMQPFLIMR